MKVKLVNGAPILLVSDVVKSASYYRDRLGFSYERFWGEPPDFCIIHRDGFHIMLSHMADKEFIVPHRKAVETLWDIYVWVDDADSLHEELKQRGARITYAPCEKPYGCREFGVQDLDGYDVAFGHDTG